jgi:hypothetical protein
MKAKFETFMSLTAKLPSFYTPQNRKLLSFQNDMPVMPTFKGILSMTADFKLIVA